MRAIANREGVWVCPFCLEPSADQQNPTAGKCDCDRPGLGDMVAAGLEKVGITKERVSKALGRPCGCQQRQQALNRLGERLGFGRKK